MTIENTDNNIFKALVTILEEYTEWFANIALYVSYNGEESVPENFTMPKSFTDWLETQDSKTIINPAIITPIVTMHNALISSVDILLNSLKEKQKPRHKDFIEFKNLFSSFLASIRRLEQDIALKNEGVDDLTGLRPSNLIKLDLDKEMERLSRNGNPFALMIVRIDMFDQYDDKSSMLKFVAENIRKSVRPFDDAYYLEGKYFLLSVKHTDMVGAEAVMMRILHNLQFNEKNNQNVTVSSSISEPVVGDEVMGLLQNMKADLEKHGSDKEVLLKFLDISPLERFMQTKK